MKKYVIHASDDSGYLDFWPYTAQCVQRLGMIPVLFHITSQESPLCEDEFGLVQRIRASALCGTGLQSQLIRLWGTQLFEDDLVMISDIDMFLLSREYFDITLPDPEGLIHLSCDAYGGADIRLPMCYIAGKGRVFRSTLNLTDSFEDFLVEVGTEVGMSWDSDELYLTRKLRSSSCFTGLCRGWDKQGIADRRLDRTRWEWNQENVPDYIDCHSLRPFQEHKERILGFLRHYGITATRLNGSDRSAWDETAELRKFSSPGRLV